MVQVVGPDPSGNWEREPDTVEIVTLSPLPIVRTGGIDASKYPQ
jgi:hypothetical protein